MSRTNQRTNSDHKNVEEGEIIKSTSNHDVFHDAKESEQQTIGTGNGLSPLSTNNDEKDPKEKEGLQLSVVAL